VTAGIILPCRELCEVLRSAGIAPEAGIWSAADADQLAAAGQAMGWLRILVEIIDVPADRAVAAADEVLRRLDELNLTAPRLIHGEGTACWPLIAHAAGSGCPPGRAWKTPPPALMALTSAATLNWYS
jgi:D-serine deaminase-like pyridoxal phosphate-dependent protein